MSNYLNHNRDIFKIKLNRDDYWDFHLSCNSVGSFASDGNESDCLSSFIDTEDPNCVWFEKLHSKSDTVWSKAVNEGVILNNIGYTGIDNGLINYRKDRTSNDKFMEIFLNSSYDTIKDDKRLTLFKVEGNNQIYSYKNDIVEEDGMTVSRLNGGFYQGFWKTDNGYQTFCGDVENGISFEFVFKKSNIENTETTLNDVHTENKGIFFYLGTRSENKWWTKYDVEDKFSFSNNGFVSDGYVSDDYFSIELNSDYVKKYTNENLLTNDSYIENIEIGKAFSDDYVNNEYQDTENNDCCNNYFNTDYLMSETVIDENMDLKTSEGYDLYQPNIIEYRTDNKFILFNKTKEGFDVDSWDERDEFILTDIKSPNIGNYFLLMNKTCKGYDVESINRLINDNNKKYSVLDDLYRNAFALQVKDNGGVGYKYLVKDCENGGYKIEHEFTENGLIKNDEWVMLHLLISPIGNDKMKLKLYVNGKLVLVSKELPKFNFRKLNDLYSKQEGVPYNISLGGGTQGLCDVVYLNFRETPKYLLPLEKEFGGTFIGYFKSFKSYDCLLNYNSIVSNFSKFNDML